MKTKKEYIAPRIKFYSYRTEEGFAITMDRYSEMLQLDFWDNDQTSSDIMESWGEESTLDGTGTWSWN